MPEELYQFLACDYFATGEGRTVSLLITRAYPHADDYETPGSYNSQTGEYAAPTLKKGHTAKVRAAREFKEKFGSWYLQGAENLPREQFLQKYSNHLPPYIDKILNDPEQPGNLNFSTQIHLNFS